MSDNAYSQIGIGADVSQSAAADIPSPTGPRSAEDCAEIAKAAGRDTRFAKQVKTLCGFTYEQCSQADAMQVLEITRQSWARRAETSVHASGLYLGNDQLAVHGGPLFVPPDVNSPDAQTGDHGWGDVVADINRKNKLS